MNSIVRASIGFVVGYSVFIAATLLLGTELDSVADWIRLLVKGFLIIFAAVSAVEWLVRRRARGTAEPNTGAGRP